MTTARSSPPEPPKPALVRLVELALVVPVEVGSRLVDAVPAVVDKVPSVAQRVRREVVLARFLGKLAVDQGIRELRERLTPEPSVAVDGTPADAEPTDVEPTDAAAPTGAAPDVAPREPSDPATLALADYDHLSSAQIVGKLDDLEEYERNAIEDYERATRHRRTILGKLDQLRAAGA